MVSFTIPGSMDLLLICLLFAGSLTLSSGQKPASTTTTTKRPISNQISLTTVPSTTTVLPFNEVTVDLQSKSTTTTPFTGLISNINSSDISHNETGEILKVQEQGQSPFIRGNGRQNGYRPTVGPNYGQGAYGVPFNAFIPQGLPFSQGASQGSPGIGAQGQSNGDQRSPGPISSPLDLLSGFIPSPGPGGAYAGTPTPFGQPGTGYPGYSGFNPAYGSGGYGNGLAGSAGRGGLDRGSGLGQGGYGGRQPGAGLGSSIGNGLRGGGLNGLGGAGRGGLGLGQGAVDNGSSNVAEPEQNSDEAEDEGTENTSPDYDGSAGDGSSGEEGAGDGSGGQTEGDPANDPDLAQFQNFQGGNFPGDLFPPGILSQQDLNEIQKSIEEQQRKEAEQAAAKKKQEEEEAQAQPDYDYDNANKGSEEASGEETPTEAPVLTPPYAANPVVPSYNSRLPAGRGQHQQQQHGLTGYQDPRFGQNLGQTVNGYQGQNQYGNALNQRYNSGRTNNLPASIGYNQPASPATGYNSEEVGPTRDFNYGTRTGARAGSGSGVVRGAGVVGGTRQRGDTYSTRNPVYPTRNRYTPTEYPTRGSVDYEDRGDYEERQPVSYDRSAARGHFDDVTERYRPGTLGRGGYRGEDLRDFGGHSANSDQQNEVEAGVDYSPDHAYPTSGTALGGRNRLGTRKEEVPRRFTSSDDYSGSRSRSPNVGRNRLAGVKPSVDYDGETRFPESERNRLQNPTPGYFRTQLDSPLPSNDDQQSADYPEPKGNNHFGGQQYQGDGQNQGHRQGHPLLNGSQKSSIDYEDQNNPENTSYDGDDESDNQSRADYADEQEDDESPNLGLIKDSLPSYRQTPRFVASNKKEAKSPAHGTNQQQIKSNDPFLRGG